MAEIRSLSLRISRILLFAAVYAAAQELSPVDQVIRSGRVLALADTPDSRIANSLRIAPGLPPELSFRAYESKRHGRFSDSDLMLDDAGH